MTTHAPNIQRTQLAPAPSPAAMPPPGSGGAGVAPIDPVKLLKKYVWVLAITAVVGVGLGIAVQILLARFAPRYTAEVLFEVGPREIDPTDIAAATDINEHEREMASQARAMTEEQILRAVVGDPRLRNEAPAWYAAHTVSGQFDPREAYKTLRSDTRSFAITGTNFIALRFTSGEANDAAGIINLVKSTYLGLLDRLAATEASERKDIIQRDINALNEDIARLTAERERIVAAESIDALEQREGQTRRSLQEVSSQLQTARLELIRLGSQLEDFRNRLNTGGDIYTDVQRAEVEQDPLLRGLQQNIIALQSRDQELQQRGLSAEHRERVATRNRIEATEQEANALREELLRDRFNAEYQAALAANDQLQAQHADLEDEVERLEGDLTRDTALLANLADDSANIERLQAQKSAAQEALRLLDSVSRLSSFRRVSVFQPERVPEQPSFPPPKYVAGPIGAVLLCGLVGGLLVAREALDQRIKSPADVALIPRTRVIGMVPMASEDPAEPESVEHAFRDKPNGVLAESFRQLRGSILKSMNVIDARSLVLIGGLPNSGTTSIAVNVARAAAAAEHKVLLIDANLRRPALRSAFGIESTHGLADVLAGDMLLADAAAETDTDGLHVLHAGSKDKRVYERLAASAMSRVLENARETYDLILVDAPPAIVSGDGAAIANKCDACLLVVRALSEQRGLVSRVKNELSESRSSFLGVVVNAVRSAAGGYMRQNIRVSHDYTNEAA